MKNLLVIVCAILCIGSCVPPKARSKTQNFSAPTETQPISPEIRAYLDKVEKLGLEMYKQDAFASQATDLVLARIRPSDYPHMAGWLVHEGPGSPTVTFYQKQDDVVSIVADVNYTSGRRPVVRVEPGRTPEPEEISMLAARAIAIKEGNPGCSKTVNTVVLPSTRLDAWDIYVLTPTTDPNIVPVGRHIRVTVSKKDHQVLEKFVFSNTCIMPPLNPPDMPEGAESEGFFFTHIVSDLPEAPHVFVNLAYQKRLGIITSKGLWFIENGRITYRGPVDPREMGLAP